MVLLKKSKLMTKNSILLSIIFLLFFTLVGCISQESETTTEEIPPILQIEKNIPESTQVLFSITPKKGDVEGKLFGMEYQNGKWVVTYDTIDCSVGRSGFADIDAKFEGDGMSPSGKFPIGSAFGYEKDLESKVDFIKLLDNHYWVSDTASELYNQLIEYNPNDKYSEKMRRNDHLYKYGIVIEYNTQDIQKGKGSAIFMHIERQKGAPTAGCVAMSEDNIKRLIKWIKPNQNPMIVMIKRRRCPRRFRVTRFTIHRELCRLMVRVNRCIKIGSMTAHTGVRCIIIIAVMTSGTVICNHLMRPI